MVAVCVLRIYRIDRNNFHVVRNYKSVDCVSVIYSLFVRYVRAAAGCIVLVGGYAETF